MTRTDEKVRDLPGSSVRYPTPDAAAAGVERALGKLEGRWKLVILFHLLLQAEFFRLTPTHLCRILFRFSPGHLFLGKTLLHDFSLALSLQLLRFHLLFALGTSFRKSFFHLTACKFCLAGCISGSRRLGCRWTDPSARGADSWGLRHRRADIRSAFRSRILSFWNHWHL